MTLTPWCHKQVSQRAVCTVYHLSNASHMMYRFERFHLINTDFCVVVIVAIGV